MAKLRRIVEAWYLVPLLADVLVMVVHNTLTQELIL